MGTIDEDYEGKISIMMKTEYPYQIIKGDHIAQLLLLPYITTSKSHIKRTGGFGSTGKQVYWQTLYLILDPHYLYMLIISNFQDL